MADIGGTSTWSIEVETVCSLADIGGTSTWSIEVETVCSLADIGVLSKPNTHRNVFPYY